MRRTRVGHVFEIRIEIDILVCLIYPVVVISRVFVVSRVYIIEIQVRVSYLRNKHRALTHF